MGLGDRTILVGYSRKPFGDSNPPVELLRSTHESMRVTSWARGLAEGRLQKMPAATVSALPAPQGLVPGRYWQMLLFLPSPRSGVQGRLQVQEHLETGLGEAEALLVRKRMVAHESGNTRGTE